MNKMFTRGGVAAVVGLVSAQSFAAGIDVAGVVTTIADQAAPIALIGGAVLAIAVAVKAFKWVRSAMA